MVSTAPALPSPVVESTLALLRELLPRDPACGIRLWDGTAWAPPGTRPAVTIVVNRPAALGRLLRPRNEAALVEAYLRGDLDVEGDIFEVAPVGRALLDRPRGLGTSLRLAAGAVALAARVRSLEPDPATPLAQLHGQRHSPERDRAAVTHHYDVSNRFYSLFLDPSMAYSCALFADPGEGLASAQRRKLDMICRKLRLRPGDRLLDIGCGWGALLLHAAGEYGVEALGITLSERQAEVARTRIDEAGLAGRCHIELLDYRGLTGAERFDRITSVGMFEHVGRARAAEYFGAIFRLLRPGGTYLHHAIARHPCAPPRGEATLTHRYVFPDHDLIPVGDMSAAAERQGLELRDVENLREHYALTLRRWVAALEAKRAEAVAEVGEPTYRAWRLTFAGAAREFEMGRNVLIQALFVKPAAAGAAGLPLERRDWYA